MQLTTPARALALDKTGSRSAARIAITAITTSSSINVKPDGVRKFGLTLDRIKYIYHDHCGRLQRSRQKESMNSMNRDNGGLDFIL
jgi:predicted phosphoribosyltransferase